MLELHRVSIGQQIGGLSLMAAQQRPAFLTGPANSGKSAVIRAVMGFIPIDDGHISIDGELLTPRSAPYFRKQMAYVPQHLSIPDGYEGLGAWTTMSTDERYLLLLRRAIESRKPLLIVDEAPFALSTETRATVLRLLNDAVSSGVTLLCAHREPTATELRVESAF